MSPYQFGGGAILTAIFLSILFWAFPQPKIWHEEGDRYECFGAGRYDAMREGKVCPGFDGEPK